MTIEIISYSCGEKTVKRGDDSIFESFDLYKPMLVQYFIFARKGKRAKRNNSNRLNPGSNPRLSRLMKKLTSNLPNHNLSVVTENGCIIIEKRLNFNGSDFKSNEKGNGWSKVHFQDVRNILKSTESLLKKQLSDFSSKWNDIRYIGTHNVLVGATKPGYWLQSRVDISKFKIDGRSQNTNIEDIVSQTRLDHFKIDLFGANTQLKGNLLNTSKLPSRIYLLHKDESRNNGNSFSNLYLIDIILDRIEEGFNSKSGGLSNKFITTRETIISNLRNFLITYSKLSDLYNRKYTNINLKASKIRKNAIQLQGQINDLLIGKKRGHGNYDSNPESEPDQAGINKNKGNDITNSVKNNHIEEILLHNASIYFSTLTSIDYVLVSAMHSKQKYERELDSASSALGLKKNRSLSTPDSVEKIPSLIDDFQRYYETIGFGFENLKTELEHIQSTLRNAVDVLKTFLEEKQHRITEESGRRINTLVLIFACFGLADALGNFVIFYLQGGQGLTAITWFAITMVPLILILAVLYFGLLRKRL